MKFKSQHPDWQGLVWRAGTRVLPRSPRLLLSAARDGGARRSYKYTQRCLEPTPPPGSTVASTQKCRQVWPKLHGQIKLSPQLEWGKAACSAWWGGLHPSHGPGLLPALSVALRNTQPWDNQLWCLQQADAKRQQRLQMSELEWWQWPRRDLCSSFRGPAQHSACHRHFL